MPVFADSTYFVALFNKQDPHHTAAVQAMASVARTRGAAPQVLFSDFIFDEVMTTLVYRVRRHELAVQAGERMLAGQVARMVEVSPAAFKGAWDLFKRRPDKKWSFTDCTSFRLMEALGIDTALTFDADFKAAGFKAIP